MAVQTLDFSHLFGNLRGISDRALTAHLALYQQAVDRLNAIEAAYPVVEWRAANAPASDATTEALLRTPVARLDLRPVGTLAECLQTVEGDLAARGVVFRPAWYLGTGGEDFWTADRAVSVNIPWSYANPTLWRLANRSARAAYTPEEMLKTLRHEAGHALCYAFELWREQDWRLVFGDSRAPYREEFTPVEGSRDYVEYLVGVRAHYAQKHPDEDWAETFACWLDPASNWRQQYAEWPVALRKLEYVESCWRAGLFAKVPPNTYLGRREPYQLENRTVAAALEIGTAAPPLMAPTGWSQHAELLRQEPAAFNAVVLHEALFAQLGRFAGPTPDAAPSECLLAEVAHNWGSWESYLLDLRLCCAASSNGWALTIWDERRTRIRNAMIDGNGAVPVGCRVLLAIDTWEHAYALDYGIGKHLGIAAQIENIEWPVVAARLEVANPAPVTIVQTFPRGTVVGDPDAVGEPRRSGRAGLQAVSVDVHTAHGEHKAIRWKKVETNPRPKTKDVTGKEHSTGAPGAQLPLKVLDRLKTLGVSKLPPSHIKEIEIHDRLHNDKEVHGGALIKWKDDKGRTQMGLSAENVRLSHEKVFARTEKLRPQMPKLKAELEKQAPTSPPHAAAALIADTGLRRGSDDNLPGHYGALTMEVRHVKFAEGKAHIEFVGKEGMVNKAVVENPVLVKALQTQAAGKKPNERLWPKNVHEKTVQATLLPGMKIKDLRTIAASDKAEKLLAANSPNLTGNAKVDAKAIGQINKTVATLVSQKLNNSPAQAFKSYIAPQIFQTWGAKHGIPSDWTRALSPKAEGK